MTSPSDDDKAPHTYGSDDEPPPEAMTESPAWRLDPCMSLSDWTLVIVFDDNDSKAKDVEEKSKLFHVHKQNLAVGPRSSQYFATLFSGGGRFAESTDATSRIPLHPLAASHFETLLDYMYTGQLRLATENATALYSMAKYFDIRLLRWEAKQFWRHDVDKGNAPALTVYYEHALIFKEEKMVKVMLDSCAQHVMKFQPDVCSPIAPERGLTFWLAIVHKKPLEVDIVKFSRQMSLLIGAFLQRHVKHVDTDSFHQLTDAEKLPFIDPNVAMIFVDAERQIEKEKEDDNKALSSLQKRCIEALAEQWDWGSGLEEQFTVLARDQNPSFLVGVISVTREKAKMAQKSQKSLLSQLGKTRSELHRVEAVREGMKMTQKTLRSQLAETRSELVALKRNYQILARKRS